MTTGAGWKALATIAIPVFIVLGLLIANAGKHPETLVESPYTYWLATSVLASVAAAALMQRVFHKSVGFSECMVILSIVLACVVLVLLFTKNMAFRGPVGDVMGWMVLFYTLSGIVGGTVLAVTNKKGMWLLASALSIVLLAFDFFALLSNAKHWGNF